MAQETTTGLRKNSPLLALALTLTIVIATISLTLIWPPGHAALSSDGSPRLVGMFSDYQGPQQCAECHATEFHAWSTTTHAQASFDPIFQVYLQDVEEPGECFSCHTTGYNTVTGQFVLAGVTCEACHGPYRPEHPEESMTIASSEELCGTCHTSTLVEWRSSRHGSVGISCVACHEVHTQKTRAALSTDLLCAGCHQDRTQDSTHRLHAADQLRCIDCHLSRPEDNVGSSVNGHAITGHSFTADGNRCSSCHPTLP